MALQTSGPISLNEIHIEAGGTTGTTCTIQDADIRELVGAQSASTISFSEFLGAAAPFSYSISNSIGNSVNKMNVATYLTNEGWDGVGAVTLTIPSNVFVWSDSTATAGMTISGSFPNGLTVVNSGKIIGKGGNGGDNSNIGGGSANGGNGGPAIKVTSSSTIQITNNNGAFIAGGGGGGAAADQLKNTAGQNITGGSGTAVSAAGAGGAGGSAGGGRKLPGSGGVFVSPFDNPSPSGIGDGGSGNNAAGIGGFATNSSYPNGFITGGGGGGWGASGGSVAANQQGVTGMFTAASGGSGGGAITKSGSGAYNLTNNGTVYGSTA